MKVLWVPKYQAIKSYETISYKKNLIPLIAVSNIIDYWRITTHKLQKKLNLNDGLSISN